jgi:gamma-glutamyltranspeptidase/glutathione hydrolase
MVIKNGKPRYALGLPGGLRIFTSELQAVINLIDHGMSLQEAVEAPRIWTQGYELELEPAFSAYSAQTGHSVHRKLISDPTANWTAIPAQSDHFGAKRRGVNSLLR